VSGSDSRRAPGAVGRARQVRRSFIRENFWGGIMVEFAYAQAAQGATGPGPLMTMFPFIIILVIMYFMVFRPQQKKQKEHQEMLNKIKRNDEVMTSGGIYGKVIEIKDQVVILEVAPNVRIRVNRPQISAVTTADKAPAKDGKD
jgi:preprotein translocase subunit YajC